MKWYIKINPYKRIKHLEELMEIQFNTNCHMEKHNKELKRDNESIRIELNTLQCNQNKLKTTLESICHIGTDVNYSTSGRSWSVICIEGNINVVKFVDLGNRDMRDILSFLKQYEGGRHCIDTGLRYMDNEMWQIKYLEDK